MTRPHHAALSRATERGKPALITQPQKETMSNLNIAAAVKAAQQLQQMLATLTARKAELSSQRTALLVRNDALLKMPVSPAEAKELVLSSIDLMASRFAGRSDLRKVFEAFAWPKGQHRPYSESTNQYAPQTSSHDGPLNLADIEAIEHRGISGLSAIIDLAGMSFLSSANGAEVDPSAFYFYFGDLIKAKLSATFEHHFPDMRHGTGEALTIEAKRAEIAANASAVNEIDEELASIEQQLVELQAAGVKAVA